MPAYKGRVKKKKSFYSRTVLVLFGHPHLSLRVRFTVAAANIFLYATHCRIHMRQFGSSKLSETLKHCLQQVLFPFCTHNPCHFEIVLSFSTPGPHIYRKSDHLTCMWF